MGIVILRQNFKGMKSEVNQLKEHLLQNKGADNAIGKDFEFLAENINEIVFLLDIKGNIIFGNELAAGFLGLNKTDMKTSNLLDYLPNETITRSFSNGIRICIDEGSSFFDFHDFNSNTVKYYETRMTQLSANEILVLIKNVSYFRENEKQLQMAKNQAEQASKSKTEFLANITHELRTPLNAIIGIGQFLVEETDNKVHQEYLEVILANSNNLLKMVNDILDIAKLEKGELDLEMQPTNYRDVIHGIRRDFEKQIEQKGLSFNIRTDASVPDFIMMDKHRFYQVMYNLVSNAVKFTLEGFVSVSAFAMKTKTKNIITLNIEIEDSGIGIEKDKQKTIFELFTQQNGESTRGFDGTGLGLSIVDNLLKKLDGTIELKSAPNKGTLIRLTFKNIKVDTNKHHHISTVETKSAPGKKPKTDPSENSYVDKEMLPEVINAVEAVHWENWLKIKDSLVIFEIEEFHKHLAELGIKKACGLVSEYCNELDMGLQTFDIEAIENKLNDFPALVDKLKSLSV